MFFLDVCGIPDEIANTVGAVYNILLVAVPVLVVLFGTIDFVKAVISGKEDEIKKNTATFVKRLITGLIVFFILAFAKFIIGVIKTNNTSGVVDCLDSIFGNSKQQDQ